MDGNTTLFVCVLLQSLGFVFARCCFGCLLFRYGTLFCDTCIVFVYEGYRYGLGDNVIYGLDCLLSLESTRGAEAVWSTSRGAASTLSGGDLLCVELLSEIWASYQGKHASIVVLLHQLHVFYSSQLQGILWEVPLEPILETKYVHRVWR